MAQREPNRWALLTSRPTHWSVLVPIVAMLAGLLFSASSQAARGTDLRSEVTGMPDLIRERNLANARRTSEITALRNQVDALAKRAAPGNAQLETLNQIGDAAAGSAGVVPVHGPTLTVALDDSPLSLDQLPSWANVNDIVVHQQDVQAVVNALWRGGAEAMTIMDQRVISTSAVRCVGNTLLLQGRVYSPPFVISAMGDVDAMEAALKADPAIKTYQEYVDALRMGYSVERTGEKTFPAYSGTLTLEHAKAGK